MVRQQHFRVVDEVLSDARSIENDGNSLTYKLFRWTNTGIEENVRCRHRTRTHDHMVGTNASDIAVVENVDADRTGTRERDTNDVHSGFHPQIRPVQRRHQIPDRRTDPTMIRHVQWHSAHPERVRRILVDASGKPAPSAAA